MVQDSTQNGAGRPAMLAMVMLAVLLGCMALAWWISSIRQGHTDKGTQIVRRIQSDGLQSFWSGADERYYLIVQRGQPVGYFADFRGSQADDGFDGLNVHVVNVTGKRVAQYQRWHLANSGKAGWFQVRWANEVLRGQWERQSTPRVHLVDGQLVNPDEEDPQANRIQAPANYLPEDTVLLAAQLVAKDKTQAFFRAYYPEKERADSPLSSVWLLNLLYKGRQTIQVDGKGVEVDAVEVRKGVRSRETIQTFYLSPAGQVVQISSGDVVYTPTTLDRIGQLDNQAGRLLLQFAADSRMPLAIERPKGRP